MKLAIEIIDQKIDQCKTRKAALIDLSRQIRQKQIFVNQQIATLLAQLILFPFIAISWIMVHLLSAISVIIGIITGSKNSWQEKAATGIVDGLFKILKSPFEIVVKYSSLRISLPFVNAIILSILTFWKMLAAFCVYLYSQLYSLAVFCFELRRKYLQRNLNKERENFDSGQV